ncbi:MAG TPA: HEAT repeat domain-containing protein [Thermoanaerobaculia bacterium]|jgi:HEAT repeat protein|nr:HEAT repeat domain-containing protein [Thermoanaerobaculia bacterium]
MTSLIIAGVVCVSTLGVLLAVRKDLIRENPRCVQRWHDTVTAYGLQVVEQSGSFEHWFNRLLELEARDGALQVRIEGFGREYTTRVAVSIPGPPGYRGLRIHREELRRPTAREIAVITIGGEDFAAAFSVEGPKRLVAMLLDAETRSLLARAASQCWLEIVNGEIVAQMEDGNVPFILPLLLDLGRCFARRRDAAQCLADNARRDPEANVRRLNLHILAQDFPEDPRTPEVLRQACADPSPWVRLEAARSLGAEGRDVLLEIVESQEEDDCRAQAIASLGGELPFELGRDLLSAALRRRHLQTAHACLTSLVQDGHPEAVDILIKVLTREQGELAAAAALALGETGSLEAEPPLIHALGSGMTEVQAAAARALGHVGSAAAVLPLKEAAENPSWDDKLRRAARQSIAEIQSRLPGASHGQLALAGKEAGQLALADSEAGQLSLAVDQTGQLSLPESEEPQRPERTSG